MSKINLSSLSVRIWILIIVLLLALFSIFVTTHGIGALQEGVLITSVETNTSSYEQGLREGQIVTKIDNKEVKNIRDFSASLKGKFPAEEKKKLLVKTKESGEFALLTDKKPSITVSKIPSTSIKTGLDLSGGARAIIKAENKSLSKDEASQLSRIISRRFNVYGIRDVTVNTISDLSGNNFILIKIAGATPEDLRELVSKQGKFEAKIGNETVFTGGENQDITSVSMSGARSGITDCQQSQEGGNFCKFRFSVYLSPEAAKKHAEITAGLGINETEPKYLDKKLRLLVDGKEVDSLFISKNLKGDRTSQISISGSGSGKSRQQAYEKAEEEMKKLQTVLITGSLPFKLEVVKLDTVSPTLGKQFSNSLWIAGIAGLLAIGIIVFIRYRSFKSTIALLFTSTAEVIIVLGLASAINWNLDLPSIAGILATIGTGIDSQIIILDESRIKETLGLKQKLKRALSIILGAYFTALVALLPLMWAGAGLLKGFAITTIMGITIGVFITRPAFADIVKRIYG